MARVPARWVGAYPVNLRAIDGPHYDADGKLIRDNVLRPGDTLMVHAQEAFGQTIKWDPTGNTAPLYLGVGRVTLPEHEGLPADQLAQLGYEFQEPSRNWQALVEPSRGPVPGEESVPLGTDQAGAQLDQLAQVAQEIGIEVPSAPPTPEEIADRQFRRKPRPAQAPPSSPPQA